MARGEHDLQKQKVAEEIRFDIPNVPFGVGRCVYKLYYGDRYIINYGKDLAGSLFLLQKGYAYHVAYEQQEADDKKNKTWIKFYRYIQKNPNKKFKVEVIFKSKSAYQIIKRCQIELDKSFSDRKCLNNNLTAYIPLYRPNLNMYGWITPRQVALFKSFLEKRDKL